jgi:hypothetical protein
MQIASRKAAFENSPQFQLRVLRENDIKSRRDDRAIRRNFPPTPLGLDFVFGR